MAKRSLARSAGEIFVTPGHKLSCCDSRCSPDMYSPDTIGLYISFKTAGGRWHFAKKAVGLANDAERNVSRHHQDAGLKEAVQLESST